MSSSYHSEGVNVTKIKLKRKLKDLQESKFTLELSYADKGDLSGKYKTTQDDKLSDLINDDSNEQDDEIGETLNDEDAGVIYSKIMQQCQGRQSYAKKNWSHEETQLLKWAVAKYTKERSIAPSALVSIKQLMLNFSQ